MFWCSVSATAQDTRIDVNSTLSGGEFQKLMVAHCLLARPAFIFLDESWKEEYGYVQNAASCIIMLLQSELWCGREFGLGLLDTSGVSFRSFFDKFRIREDWKLSNFILCYSSTMEQTWYGNKVLSDDRKLGFHFIPFSAPSPPSPLQITHQGVHGAYVEIKSLPDVPTLGRAGTKWHRPCEHQSLSQLAFARFFVTVRTLRIS